MRQIICKKSFTVASTGLIAIAIAMSLSGCIFANNFSPVELGVEGGHATLAFCKGGTIESIRVAQRVSSTKTQWETVWEGSGDYEVRSGDVLTLDGPVEGFIGEGDGLLDLSDGSKYFVQITVASKRDGGEPLAYESNFDAPDGGLGVGEWLDYQGGRSVKACD